MGEGAVDAGGPRREFFRLLAFEAAYSTSYFCGDDDHTLFACNVPAVRVRYNIIISKLTGFCL